MKSQPAFAKHRMRRLAARGARGFVLMEVLIAGLIFSFGVLGVVGLHAQMTRAQTVGKYRVDAMNLANEAIGTMWSDFPNLGDYDYTAGGCSGNTRCSAWSDKVARALPGGAQRIDVQAGNVVVVTISWTTPDGTSSYSTQTQMVI